MKRPLARSRPPAFSAEVIPLLVAALGSRSRGVRYHAATALAPHATDPRAAVAIPALLALLDSRGATLGALSTHRATLEDVFVTLTGRRLRD